MALVFDPPVYPPPPPPAEDASNLWELPYESMGFHREDDPSTGYQLQKALECLCGPYQDIHDLLREREDGTKPWEILFDPDRCPAKWLPYLAQVVGVELTPEMSDSQKRDEIKHPTSWKRGQPESIKIAIRRCLRSVEGEEMRVILRPRTPSVGHTYLRVLKSQCPDVARAERVARENVPAWELIDFAAIDAVSFADVEAAWDTFADEEAAFTTFAEDEDLLPTELP